MLGLPERGPARRTKASGPSWLCQDAAAAGTYVHNVLRLAVDYPLMPILSRPLLVEAPEVDVTAARTFQVAHELVNRGELGEVRPLSPSRGRVWSPRSLLREPYSWLVHCLRAQAM